MDLHPEQQKACLPGTYKKPKPSLSSEELLGDDEFDPGELEGKVIKYHNGTFSPALLLTINAERQKPFGEIERSERV